MRWHVICIFSEGIPEIFQVKGMPGLITGDGATEDAALREVAALIDSAMKIVETKLVDV